MLNTNQIYNEAGTGAPDFPSGMPTVGGDPIVESGSNSDGEWTRWANGTQIVSITHIFTSGVAGYNTVTVSLPVSFIDADLHPSATQRGIPTPTNHFTYSVEDFTTSTVLVAMVSNAAWSTDVYIYASIFGRWK